MYVLSVVNMFCYNKVLLACGHRFEVNLSQRNILYRAYFKNYRFSLSETGLTFKWYATSCFLNKRENRGSCNYCMEMIQHTNRKTSFIWFNWVVYG